MPFDDYIDVGRLREYHRVIPMDQFMADIAPMIWKGLEFWNSNNICRRFIDNALRIRMQMPDNSQDKYKQSQVYFVSLKITDQLPVIHRAILTTLNHMLMAVILLREVRSKSFGIMLV